jgi:hypothetical protein
MAELARLIMCRDQLQLKDIPSSSLIRQQQKRIHPLLFLWLTNPRRYSLS